MKKTGRIKQNVYGQLARIGKSLSSGPRLEILDLLSQGPRTVESLAGQVEQSIANTSRHLQVLRRARLVEAERDGVHIRYRIAGDDVSALLFALRGLAESRLHELEHITRELRESHGGAEPVSREGLVERVRSGEVTVLDVRPAEEYAAGHLPGAVSIPLPELERRLAEIPRDRSVVAYCRGPYCVMAIDAATLLRREGFVADHIGEGVADWRALGLPVESFAEASS